MELPASILSLFAMAALAPWLERRLPRAAAGWIFALLPAGLVAWMAARSGEVLAGSYPSLSLPWAPEQGLSWDLWFTGPGLFLGLLVAGIGALICIYGGAYLSGHAGRGRFFGLLFLFMGSMLGLAFTEHLVVFFVFWELTSVASYLLIGFQHRKEEARRSALDALLVTAGGGLALLAGILLLGDLGGSYRLSELAARHGEITGHPLYPLVFGLVALGAATKSAQFPFHFWLPGAMAAPAPVSAYLHSATMVKAGVFLLILMQPVLGGTALWHDALLACGAVTMTWGAVFAVVQRDLKRLLAFSTVSALGTLVMLLGIGTSLAFKAAAVLFLVHALYKGALFMVAGALDKATGTRDVSELRGLFHHLPILGVAAAAAAFSMSGIPPFVGFIAKELLYEVKMESPAAGWMLLACSFATNTANVVVALKVGVAPFLAGAAWTGPVKAAARGVGFWLGPAVLAAASLAIGLFPNRLVQGIIKGVVQALSGDAPDFQLQLWHGINPVLLLSALTVACGIAIFAARGRLWLLGAKLASRERWSAQFLFREQLEALVRQGGRLTRLIQSGLLTRYLRITALAAVALLAAAWWQSGYRLSLPALSPFRPEGLTLLLLVSAGALAATMVRDRMTAVLCLGCSGFGISGLYGLYGAPDLAITQILVETLVIVLFALHLYRLPRLRLRASRRRIWRDASLASLVGIAFALLTLKALDIQIEAPVAGELAARSVPEAFGRNVVNVILVDFRSLDTLGEITVLLLAALGVSAMLGLERPGPLAAPENSPVLRASARFVAPAMGIFSLYLLLRGHNEPGGGFIGGLAAAMSALLVFLSGRSPRLVLLGLEPRILMALGVALAALSGLPGALVRDAYLAALWGAEFSLPAVGKIKLGTPLVFDIGVYLLVAGMVLELVAAATRQWRAPSPASP